MTESERGAKEARLRAIIGEACELMLELHPRLARTPMRVISGADMPPWVRDWLAKQIRCDEPIVH